MGIFYHLERKMNYYRQRLANERQWKRRREREKLPDPLHTWTKDGCIIECYVIRSGFSIWSELEVLFRIGTVKLSGTYPRFSRYFSSRQSAVLLELLDDAKRWPQVFSTMRFRDTIPARRWKTIFEAQPESSRFGSKTVGSSGRVMTRACKLGQAPGTLYAVFSTTRDNKGFFNYLDVPDLEEQLYCMVEDERVVLDMLFRKPIRTSAKH